MVLFSSDFLVRGVHIFLRCSVSRLQWMSTSPSALGIAFFTGGGPDWNGLRTRRVASVSLSHSICLGDRDSMVPRVMSSGSSRSCVVGLSGGFWLVFGGGSSFAGCAMRGV